MAGTKILVTGGCGRIGRRLVEKLAKEGNLVTVVDRYKGEVPNVHYVQSEVKDMDTAWGAEIVYHLAAKVDYRASLEDLMKANAEPAENLLKLCKDCKQFIFMSTTSVYDESDEPLKENLEMEPYSNYGKSKLACEQLVRDSGVPYTIMRSSQVFGPDFEEGFAKILRLINEGDMKIIGAGDNMIPLIHVDDLLSALLFVKGLDGAINQTLNVDGGYQKTQAQFMELAAKILHVEPPTKHVSPTLAKLTGKFIGKGSSVSEYVDKLTMNRLISTERISRLGFLPKVELESGIRETIKAFKQKGLI